MKKVFAWLCIAAAMAAMPVSAYAAEIDTETEPAVIEQQAEARPGFQFGKRFERLSYDGEKKFAALPEGFEKPELGEFMKKGFGKFKKTDGAFEMNKEVMQEKLAELDRKAQEFGISRNELINQCIDFALANLGK